jgi:hypothetical protein
MTLTQIGKMLRSVALAAHWQRMPYDSCRRKHVRGPIVTHSWQTTGSPLLEPTAKARIGGKTGEAPWLAL